LNEDINDIVGIISIGDDNPINYHFCGFDGYRIDFVLAW
jgi:hypothetical protein